MSEAKLLELIELSRQEGDEQTELLALQKLKEVRSTGSSQQPEEGPLDTVPLEVPQPTMASRALGTGEVLTTMATGALAEPVSGVVGLGGLAAKGTSDVLRSIGMEGAARFMDPGDLGALVEGVHSTLTHSPMTKQGQAQLRRVGDLLKPLATALEKSSQALGDPVLEATGSPALAATAASLPEAALELIPGLSIPKGAYAAPFKARARSLMEKARRMPAGPETNAKRIADTITQASMEDIVLDADLNPDFFKAADDLGINTAPVASFGSQNLQFIEIEQMLSALQGSSLSKQAADFVGEVSQRASTLIDDMGGARRGELSERFKAETTATVDDLFNQADDLYNIVDQGLDKTAKVDAPQTMSFVDRFIEESGGKPSPIVSKIKKDLETVTRRVTGYTGEAMTETLKQPTYGRLVQLRQEVGQAIGKGTGPFKDANTGFLKKLYSKLRQDQDAFAAQSGVFDELKAADQLVIQRKLLEDNLTDLLGKDLQRSLEPAVSGAVSGLTKGKAVEFDTIMNKIPSEYRQEAVATALRESISGRGATQGDFSANALTKFMGRLSDESKAKIYQYLPDGGKGLEDLTKLARGINRAQASRKDTGVVKASLDMFNKERGLMSKLVGKPVEATVKAYGGIKGGPAGAAVASNFVDNFLNQTTDRATASAALLSSNEFRDMITQAVSDGVHQGNLLSNRTLRKQAIVEKSRAAQRWADTLSNPEKSRLASIGLTQFLIPETETAEVSETN